jgi:hypothetical protein
MDEVNGGVEGLVPEVVKPKRVVSPETREKMRLAKLGKTSPMKGKTMPESAKERIRQARLGKPSNRIIGKLNQQQ